MNHRTNGITYAVLGIIVVSMIYHKDMFGIYVKFVMPEHHSQFDRRKIDQMDYSFNFDPLTSPDDGRIFTLPYNENDLANDITFVTEYFLIKDFMKIWHGINQTKTTYLTWMRTYSKVENKLVVYMDNKSDMEEFKKVRSALNPSLTKAVLIPRNKLWSYSILPNITSIFANKSYPKFKPNTMQAEYPCAMHTKYEIMLHTLKDNPYKTKFFCWIDFGLFRHIWNNTDQEPFTMTFPKDFNKSKIAYTQVNEPQNITELTVFMKNLNWVSGAVFIAKASVMMKMVKDYLQAVKYYLSRGLMATDQQLLYAMRQDPNVKFHAEMQLYPGYFPQLGYMMKNEGDALKNKGQRKNVSSNIVF